MRKVVHTAVIALSLSVAFASTACTSTTNTPANHPETPTGPVNPVQVSDDQFGPAVHKLLLNGERSSERLDLLVGVVRKQLEHAKQRFETGHPDQGVAALTGALYLVRVGELRPEMFVGGEEALKQSADAAAQVGDEGRARALYGMLKQALPAGKARDEVDQHLAALKTWMSNTRRPGSMSSLKDQHNADALRSLLEPSKEAMDAANKSTTGWVSAALSKNLDDMPMEDNADREEAVSVFQAVRTGSFALAAVYLRQGDAKGAFDAIQASDVGKVAPPPLLEALDAAAKEQNPEAWAALLEVYTRAETPDRPETAMSPDLAAGAAWGCAVQLYRAEPYGLRAAGTLSTLLMRYGMSEASPQVLVSALEKEPQPRNVSTGLALLLRAIVDLDEINDVAAARRTFAAADRLLALADSQGLKGRVNPSPGRLHYVMGAIESRAGELDKAKPHIEAAVASDPTVEALSLLAAIDRQRGAYDDSLRSLNSMAEQAGREGDKAAETRALTTRYEVLLEAGRKDEAPKVLERALRTALDARRLARSNAQLSEAERQLARVMEHYGDAAAARRATQRAYEASGGDIRQVTATVLDAARRALTLGDLRAGREALRQAVESDIPDGDLVYVALWLQLLERRVKASSDGSVEAALQSADGTDRWGRKLRAWGTQQLADTELLGAAQNRVEKTEATFYAALSNPSGDLTERLKSVASSETIELVEVMIARDMLKRADSYAPPDLPKGVTVP
ncbi:MAG: tetratricopeptide repeat protein [Polyangiaceae bacterium]